MRRCFLAGAAKKFDHGSLIHALWKRFAELGVGAWVERVPTEVPTLLFEGELIDVLGVHCFPQVNIADDPSREEYEVLHALADAMELDTIRVAPMMDAAFIEAQAWHSLSVSNVARFRRTVPSE